MNAQKTIAQFHANIAEFITNEKRSRFETQALLDFYIDEALETASDEGYDEVEEYVMNFEL